MKKFLVPVVIALSLCAGTVSATTVVDRPVLVQGLPDFTKLVEFMAPSVVNIRTLGYRPKEDKPEKAAPKDDAQNFVMPQKDDAPKIVPLGTGSGFIITSNGYIMTNAHVVNGAVDMIVTLTNGREYKGRIVGTDVKSDVAVIKVEAQGLRPVMFGDSDSLKAGQWVVAIGSPFGFENTVTAGIVSALRRDTGEMFPFIQTDVVINPGNSGGPLINMQGEVVGINSQIYSGSGGFMGISFSIPINEALVIKESLVVFGKVNRGKLGVSIDSVNADDAASNHLSKGRGALIESVEEGGPAALAGIQAGDIIIKFNSEVLKTASDLPRFVSKTTPNSVASVVLIRKGKILSIAVKMGAYADK